MRSNRVPLLATSILLLMCAACASQPERRGPPPGERGGAGANYSGMAAKPVALFFATLDSNRDTRVDDAELAHGLSHEWTRMTSSEQVSALEFGAWSQTVFGAKETLPSFIAFDHDLDGRFTQADFVKRMQFEFDRLDADQSGTLDRSELLFRVARPAQRSGSSEGRERPRGEGRGRPR